MATYRQNKSGEFRVTLKQRTLEKLRRLLLKGDIGSAVVLLDCCLDHEEQLYYASLAKELSARSLRRDFKTTLDYYKARETLDDLIL